MNAIILCGGLSTRLGDITKSIPKVLLPIGDRTVLDWQLEKLKRAGIDTVVMAAGHLSEVLRREVGEMHLGVKIIYAIEPEKLGTGGAIKYALDFVPDKEAPTIILNGDILSTLDITHMQERLRLDSEGMLLGAQVEDASSYGTLCFDASFRLESFKEKEGRHEPGVINGGVYLFTQKVHTYFPETKNFSIEYDVFPRMKDLDVFVSEGPWIDIGVPERLEWARKNWNIFV